MRFLNIGGPIALAVIGAILYFAINVDTSGFELSTIGLIMMIAGAVWFVVGIALAVSMSSRADKPVVEERRTTTVDERL